MTLVSYNGFFVEPCVKKAFNVIKGIVFSDKRATWGWFILLMQKINDYYGFAELTRMLWVSHANIF